MADDGRAEMMAGEVMMEKLSIVDGEEYTDFLIEAYKDQFHAGMFRDRKKVKDRWLWEYVQNPAPADGKPLIWILRIGGKIAGQMCVMPVTLNIFGRPYKAGWCQDFIVLPGHRKKGMGYSIVKQVTEQSGKYVEMLLAIVASEASYRIFSKASYIDAGFMDRAVIISNPGNFSGAVTGNAALRIPLRLAAGAVFGVSGIAGSLLARGDVEVAQYSGTPGELDALCSEVSRDLPLSIRRSGDFISWRFVDEPRGGYKIFVGRSKEGVRGYLALREEEVSRGRLNGLKAGIISDILCDPEDRRTAQALLGAAIGYFKGRVDIIRSDFLGPRLRSAFRLAGFIDMASRNRFYAAPLSGELRAKGADFFKRGWCLTRGDSDLDLF
ncbi:MAG: GNAT family N-acetyltransferase [Candidatus Omnitrophica bacterium]|nr:GNAT family N-acetyltransferase [Candidatus Omnitrophota bacterium]